MAQTSTQSAWDMLSHAQKILGKSCEREAFFQICELQQVSLSTAQTYWEEFHPSRTALPQTVKEGYLTHVAGLPFN